MYEITLPYREPFDWTALLRFFEARAVPGIEVVERGRYRRNIRFADRIGSLEVVRPATGRALVATVDLPVRTKRTVDARLRAMLDLDCDPDEVIRVLGRSPDLRSHIRRHPGIRVPGAWEPFEILVRAIVGQQVSVSGARTILGRLVEHVGHDSPRVFPSAEEIAAVDLKGFGMPHGRAENLRAAAAAFAEGGFTLDGSAESRRRLLALRGIGPWTVEYVAMRAFRDRDAFPDGDLVLRKVAGGDRTLTSGELRERAEAWRPWRAYAAMLLWSGAVSGERPEKAAD